MDFQFDRDYVPKALTTAVYPEQHGLRYTTYGLCGEIGEYLGKYSKWIRGDDGQYPIAKSKQFTSKLIDELGDVCWYAAMLYYECEKHKHTSPEFLKGFNVNFHELLPTGAVYAAEGVMHSLYKESAFILTEFADGQICNTNKMLSHLKFVLMNIAKLAIELGTNFEDVCNRNAEKLAARKKEGTLRGDGDGIKR